MARLWWILLAKALSFLLLFVVLSSPTQANPRGLTPDDLVRLRRASGPVLSPDGRRVAFTVRETDMAKNRGHTEIYVMTLGRTPTLQRLTREVSSSRDPRWSASGDALYFLSSRFGSSQVWRLSFNGGEAVPITDLPLDVESFELAPQGDRLAVSLSVFRDCETLVCTRDRLKNLADAKSQARLYDALFVRHWDTWSDSRRSVLFTLKLDAEGRTQGEPINISGSLDGDVPGKPFGDESDYTFSPDGKTLVYAVRVAGKAEAWSTNFDLYQSPVTGGAPVNLTPDNLASDAEPRFSPDGRTLAYKAMDRAGFEADRFHLVLLDVATGKRRALANDWDHSVASYRWTKDGSALIVQTADTGQEPLFRIDARNGAVLRLTQAGTVESFDVSAEQILYTQSHLSSPAELYSVDLKGGNALRLTQVNREALSDVQFGAAEQFSFQGAANQTVYGYVMKPWNAKPGQKYPVAFLIHGGPQGSFGNGWSYRWNPQIYSGAGYAVVFIDFHGSTGYGQAFTDSISGDWGGKPLEDLKKGLAAAQSRFDWLDGDRVCALGASYGGYMINLIAGNWSDRFRCLVNHDGIFDSRAMYYSTEELWFEEWEHAGPAFAAPELYEKFSPSKFVANWKTPMLVIQGEQDFRVPLEQGLSTFTALQRRGIESKLLVFPDENHWVLKPENSLRWHREVLGWLDQHLNH